MSVQNVYNKAKANAIAAIKSNLANSGTNKTANAKPEYMKMTGSIFNAPKAQSNPVATLSSQNVKASLSELYKAPIEGTQSKDSNDKSSSNGNSDLPGSASEGRAATSDVKAQSSKAKELRQESEKNTDTANNYSKTSAKLQKKTQTDTKKFKAQQVKLEAQIKSDNQKLEKYIQENEESQLKIDNAQREIETLVAKNSSDSNDEARIKELKTIIGSTVGAMQANGKVVYSLKRNQSRTLKQLSKANTQYIKVNNKNVKAMKSQQNETSKILTTAAKIETISATVQSAGQALDTLGKLMVAAGTTPWTSWMVPVGQVMSKVGTVAEMVGQYGVAAANVTKTAAYAAEGNIMGAMQSAAMAAQAGTAAAKSTKNLKNEWKNIDTKANESLNKNAANQAAKQQVEDMKAQGADFKGMSEKNMKKSISNDLQAQMNGENPTLNRKDLFTTDGKLSAAGQTATNTSAQNVQNKFNENLLSSLPKDYTYDKATGEIKNAKGNVIGNVKNKDSKDVAAIVKKANSKTQKGFRNNAAATRIKTATNWNEKMQQSFSTFASIYGMSQNNGTTSNKRHAEQWDLYSDPRMARIMNSNQSYRMHRAYA